MIQLGDLLLYKKIESYRSEFVINNYDNFNYYDEIHPFYSVYDSTSEDDNENSNDNDDNEFDNNYFYQPNNDYNQSDDENNDSENDYDDDDEETDDENYPTFTPKRIIVIQMI